MQARKIMAGSLLAAGLGVAGAIGSTGTAQAAPGAAVSVGGVNVGIGKDDTLFAKITGIVQFVDKGRIGRFISIQPVE